MNEQAQDTERDEEPTEAREESRPEGKLADPSRAQYAEEVPDQRTEALRGADEAFARAQSTEPRETSEPSDASRQRMTGGGPHQGVVTAGAEEDEGDVERFHTGGGWYDLPDVGKVQGREQARSAWEQFRQR